MEFMRCVGKVEEALGRGVCLSPPSDPSKYRTPRAQRSGFHEEFPAPEGRSVPVSLVLSLLLLVR